METAQGSGDRRRLFGSPSFGFLKVSLNEINGGVSDFDSTNIVITGLTPKGIDFKVMFENPSLVSMSDQSLRDVLNI